MEESRGQQGQGACVCGEKVVRKGKRQATSVLVNLTGPCKSNLLANESLFSKLPIKCSSPGSLLFTTLRDHQGITQETGVQ